MNARKLIELVQQTQEQAGEDPVNLYDFAHLIADEQKEEDAQIAEAANQKGIADAIRSQ